MRKLTKFAGGTVLLALIVTAYFANYKGNFGVVIPGQIYRSGQLSAAQLQSVINQYKIKSVINLRGHDDNSQWYQQEKNVTEKSGAVLINAEAIGIGLQSLRLPSKAELQRIITLINAAPRPMLVHCLKGADRTGLFSSLAVLLQPGSTLDQAWEQSSLRYFAIHDSVGRLFMSAYQQWLDGREHDRSLLLHWVNSEYIPHYYLVSLSPIDPPAVIAAGKSQTLKVRVANDSPEVIPLRTSKKDGAVLGSHFYKLDNGLLTRHQVFIGNNSDYDLVPGEKVELKLQLPAIFEPGEYVLTFDLIDDYAWFDAKGSPTATIAFQVKV